MSELDSLITEARDVTRRLRDIADEREIKAQRALLPPAYLGTAYEPRENRELILDDKDVAFLDYARSGRESKALVEDAVGGYLVSPVVTREIERVVEELVTVRQLASKRTIDKDRLQVRGVLADSDVELANFLADSFGRAIAETENEAFIKGAGHDSQEPEGITLNATLVAATVTTTAAGAVTVEKFLEMIYQVPAVYRKGSTFIVNSLTELELRKLRAKDDAASYEGSFLWQPSLIAGKPPTFLGYPILCDDNMETLAGAAKAIAIFGNFQRGYKILDRKGISIQRLSELYAEAGLVGFKCHARVGGYLMKPSNKALVLLTEHA